MSKKVAEKKVPVRVQRIIDACGRGETLCKQTAMTRLGTTETRWFLHPSNKDLPQISAEEATKLLQPHCDGLFGPEWSQTWGA